jgi:ATP-binding cassette, subfamily B, bacterial PglK
MLTNSSILITGDTGSLDQTDHSWVKLAVQQANVLIFNEATSALDNKTENAVMQVIDELSKALILIIIAHRLNTLKNCTQIVELCMGGIKQIGAYQQIENVSV